jgi:L-lactate dehydrogenase (cytochrome)
VLQILRDEMIMGMRLIGAPTIADVTPSMITLRNLEDHVTPVPRDELSAYTYETLKTTSKL